MLLWSEDRSPTFHEVLNYVASSQLFVVPDSLAVFIEQNSDAVTAAAVKKNAEPINEDAEEEKAEGDEELEAWRAFLQTPFDQIEPYAAYVSGTSPFGTHQGVKGLEFPRVMVIVSDEEARGFLFSYDKLFGAKGKSKTDLENERGGNETSIDRTRRLFYVICSRAMESLAIIAYSENPSAVQTRVIERQWFSAEEVEMLDQ
jgi:DNA helicase II / ATP-dependent DNA helicase PcrA